MLRATDPTKPPSRELLFLELRAIWELSAFFASYPLLRMAPRGDGHAVLVLPGLAANDTSTRPLRRFLTDQGWDANGWELGHNHGPRPGAEEKMQNRLATLFRDSGRKVSLVGWSLGGVFAREMARREPDHVRCVITLGSPFAGAPRASNAWQLYERASSRKVEDHPGRERMKTPPPVPATRDLQPHRRHRRVAGLPRARRSAHGEHRGRGQPLRARAQPDSAVCDRRSAGAAGGAVEAVRPQRAQEPDLPRSAPRRGNAGTGRLGHWRMTALRTNEVNGDARRR